ncbi:MAG: serine hydrolase domain-containing protein [Pseudomonadota bacterium]
MAIDGPVQKRLEELLSAIELASPQSVANFVDRCFTPENNERQKLSKRITTFMDWKTRGGFAQLSVSIVEPNYIEVLVQQRYSAERWRLGVKIEEGEPYRIDEILLGRAPLDPQSSEEPDAALAQRVVDEAGALSERNLFSGVVLVARHSNILAEGAFGLANRDFGIPNTMSTRFNVASLSKPWTAVAIAQLAEEGALDFEDTAGKYVEYPDAASAKAIKIKHLLSHTSGLGTYFNEKFAQTPRHFIRSVDDYLGLTAGEPPVFEAGEKWDYSNTGMVLLGKIIEEITGRSYFDHMRTAVFEPAGMDTAEFLFLDHVNDQVAIGYTRAWDLSGEIWTNNLFENFVGGCPAGGGYGTALDIHRFAEALKAGKLVSNAMVELLTNAKPDINSPFYGYGFSVHPERALFGHSGGMVGCSANLDIILDPPGWTVIILANDLGMRPVALKARQILGVTVPEADEARAYLPRGGLSAR